MDRSTRSREAGSDGVVKERRRGRGRPFGIHLMIDPLSRLPTNKPGPTSQACAVFSIQLGGAPRIGWRLLHWATRHHGLPRARRGGRLSISHRTRPPPG